MNMKLCDMQYFTQYDGLVSDNISTSVADYPNKKKEFDLGYRTQISAVFSSNIEGNSLDLNSYMNLKLKKNNIYRKKEVGEIDDLISAYNFAQSNILNELNFKRSHAILSKHILIKSKQGNYRIEKIGVFSETGLVYLAVEEQFVDKHMKGLFIDISQLLERKLTIKEVLYFASFIHLRFVHIHPFTDGNGRAARLLEKWFLTSKLGSDYWLLLSEKYYKEHQQEYYKAIDIGVNFYELNYSKCLPFLLMLPKAFDD